MKFIFSLLICIPFFGFAQIQFEEIKTKYDCHMCPGILVVKKNNLTDTLKLGSWGRLPYYELIPDNDKTYLFVESDYFSGGTNEKNIIIYSTENESFLKIVFQKAFLSMEYKYKKDEAYSFEEISREFQYKLENKTLLIKIDTTVRVGSDKTEELAIVSKGNMHQSYIIDK